MKFSKENLDYLMDREDKIMKTTDSDGNVVSISRIHKPVVDLEKRKFLVRNKLSRRDTKKWNSEYREHVIYQIIYALINPYPVNKSKLAHKLGLEVSTIIKLMKSEEYQDIKKRLRKELRDKWGADIDQKVIRKALDGSKFHADLYYKLQGELIDKFEVTKKDSIPEKEEDRLTEIKRMNKELGFDTNDLTSFNKNK